MAVTMATSAPTAWVSHPAIDSPRRNPAHFLSVCHSLANRGTSLDRRKQNLCIFASSAAQGLSSSERLELSFAVGTRLIPHPNKVEKGGEDALFVSTYNGGVLAVADGVSGWAEENIDPAVFPRELMANISSAIGDDEVKNDPQLIVRRAHETTHSIGSATLIIAMLEKNGTLKIANVGDCGLRVLRQGRIIFSTSPQEHYFDCPFQLSSEIAGQTYKDAMVYSKEVKEGDIIVMGSDGLFDNVFDHEIECVVSRFGGPEVTLRYLADSPKRLAISQFTEVQTQGVGIRRYFEYLLERVKAYQDTQTDFVRSGAGKIRSLTVDKGLLRQTEIVQAQIKALLKCDLLGGADPDNEISMTAFRLLTMDLLELFKVMNEGTINVLEHYFEMSKVDAQRALSVYKIFGRQTDLVVQYLSTARQYQAYTRLEVPKLKHAPTTLTSSLEEYLNDPDFDINRRQYLAQQEAKRTGKPVAAIVQSKPALKATIPSTTTSQPQQQPQVPQPARGPAPDLIDFFESIDTNPQEYMTQQTYPQTQQTNQSFAPTQAYQQPQTMPPQQTGYNPFMQNFGQQPQQQPQSQPQPLQPDFTGAGFGGYGPQPPQQTQNYAFNSSLASIPQDNVAEFPQQSFSPSQTQSPQSLQPQPTGTNPFRQSMMSTGSNAPISNMTLNRQSTNPFAKHNTGAMQTQQIPQQIAPPQAFNGFEQQQQVFQQHQFPSAQELPAAQTIQELPATQPLQQQKTGTNPFAKNNLAPSSANPLTVNVTGSTNPFRQSQFVNQQTGQGWQHSNQGTFGGLDISNVQTSTVFPRPGAQQQI